MDKVIETTLLTVAASACAYFAYWCWRDVHRENRPQVTNEMLDEAYVQMLENSEFYIEDDDD